MNRLLPYNLTAFMTRRFWQMVLRFILFFGCLYFIFILTIRQSVTIAFNNSSSLFQYPLRQQNNSLFHFRKFRNIDTLIHQCEAVTTLECLNYLHHNQSHYLQTLSSNQSQTFQKHYCTSTNKMLFHTFWDDVHRLDDPLLRLHIESYLYSQNRQCSNMIIWTLPTFDNISEIDNRYRIHEPYLQIRSLSPFADDLRQVGVEIGSSLMKLPWQRRLPPLAVVSDAVRFVVLNKLGGIYVDVDVLLLRDFQPLFAHEFAYRWSTLNEFNTAVLRLFPQSQTAAVVINRARRLQSPYGFYPTSLRSYSLGSSFKRIPCIFFDPIWLAADNADAMASEKWQFTNNTQETFKLAFETTSEISREGRNAFNGAFAFHWHALRKANLSEAGSYMNQWSEFYRRELYVSISNSN